MGFDQVKMNEIVEFINWNKEDNCKLNLLKGNYTRDAINDNKYCQYCYLLYSAYALAVSDRMVISTNSGFKWQLQFYDQDA